MVKELPLSIEALALHLEVAVLLSVIKIYRQIFIEPGRLLPFDSVFQLSLLTVTDALLHSFIHWNVLSRIETFEISWVVLVMIEVTNMLMVMFKGEARWFV